MRLSPVVTNANRSNSRGTHQFCSFRQREKKLKNRLFWKEIDFLFKIQARVGRKAYEKATHLPAMPGSRYGKTGKRPTTSQRDQVRLTVIGQISMETLHNNVTDVRADYPRT